MGKFIDITSRKFGRMTVLGVACKNKKGEYLWHCKCDCGTEKNVRAADLKNGKVVSCGCYRKEKAIKHGLKHDRLYKIWIAIRQRCNNPKSDGFEYYGARGIKVCKEWDDFKSFHDWSMSNGYEKHLTIDRIDVNGNYEPSNCRWVSEQVQGSNKRNNVFLEFNGKTHTLSEWSRIFGIKRATISTRYRLGKTPAEILSKEKLKRG